MQRLACRKAGADAHGPAVIEQKFGVSLLMTGNGVYKDGGQLLYEQLRDGKAARLCDYAVGGVHEKLNVVYKAVNAEPGVRYAPELPGQPAVVSADAYYTQPVNTAVERGAHRSGHIAVAHRAAHYEDGRLRVNAKLAAGLLPAAPYQKLGPHGQAKGENTLFGYAPTDGGIAQKLACRDDIVHGVKILPEGMDAVISDYADYRGCNEPLKLQLIQNLRGENMCRQDNVRRVAVKKLREFSAQERIAGDHGGEATRGRVLFKLIIRLRKLTLQMAR